MPSSRPPPARRQTIKQARASFKSRGQPTLTDREKKQLDREIELDRRAWRAKEAEKRKVEATCKRLEKEKEGRRQVAVEAKGRCDRFGLLGSQMHLGAFFGGKGGNQQSPDEDKGVAEEKWEEFEVDDLDDEILGAALDGAGGAYKETAPARSRQSQSDAATPHRQPPKTRLPAAYRTEAPIPLKDELGSFWDELDSSTQIARDLADEDLLKQETRQKPAVKSCATSFSSDGFDLTVEDLEELESSFKEEAKKAEENRKLMPPPALPIKRMQSPLQSAKHLTSASRAAAVPPDPAPPPAVPFDVGFTLSQLERFVDDDLQLTQADPG